MDIAQCEDREKVKVKYRLAIVWNFLPPFFSEVGTAIGNHRMQITKLETKLGVQCTCVKHRKLWAQQ